MYDTDILVIGGPEIDELLTGQEEAILDAVSYAYQVHEQGQSSLPHSLFLRFPHDPKSRIIALPAYLGGEADVAGMKWIASFPDNLDKGLDRASAVVIINSATTGRAEAILEGSLISAKRTAASAALGAKVLHGEQATTVGLVGCGVINLEIFRFLRVVFPGLRHVILFDLYQGRAEQFREKCLALAPDAVVEVADSLETLLSQCPVVSMATTAATPYLADLSMCPRGSTILHISLRDLAAEVILAHDNVVDDVDHVVRAQTSVHLAEQAVGNRDFIRTTLAGVLLGSAPPRQAGKEIVIFSPFGLGVLDLAVSKLVSTLAREAGRGTAVPNFLPSSWTRT